MQDRKNPDYRAIEKKRLERHQGKEETSFP